MGEPGGFILRRIKKRDPDCIKQLSNGSLRATSYAIQPRPHEDGSSWTHKGITSAAELLAQVSQFGQNPDDYTVCELAVADVIRQKGLAIHDCPTELDPGHCEIRPTEEFNRRAWGKLSKKTRILSDSEIRDPDEHGSE